jgi:hypothetical protein
MASTRATSSEGENGLVTIVGAQHHAFDHVHLLAFGGKHDDAD